MKEKCDLAELKSMSYGYSKKRKEICESDSTKHVSYSSILGHCSNQLSLRTQLAGGTAGDFHEFFSQVYRPFPSCISHANS